MFENIPLTTTVAKTSLTSRGISESTFQNPRYDRENLLNARFCITGSADSFQRPPVTDFALKNLYYMQDFNIFHYGFGSFTERRNYHSFLILYTYSGQGSLVYQNKTYSLSEGDGFFINCMDYHLYKVEGKSWDTAVLHLYGPLLPELHSQYMSNGSALFHENTDGKYQHYLEKLLTLYSYPHLHRDWQVSACIDNMLNHLLILSSHEAGKHNDTPQNIQYLMKYMENNYAKRLTLDYLASFANMNKYYLSKEFKKYTGFSPNDYLISLRINQAKTLLKTSSLPASKIAHEVGIHDINNFTNLFKKKTNMTPIQYRNSNDVF